MGDVIKVTLTIYNNLLNVSSYKYTNISLECFSFTLKRRQCYALAEKIQISWGIYMVSVMAICCNNIRVDVQKSNKSKKY